MQIFADYRINVASGELGGDSGDKVYLSAPGMLAAQYQVMEKSLLGVPGVRRIRRIAMIPSERRHFELDILLRHVADPVLSVDREGRVIAANLAAARAFGVNMNRVPGLQLQRFLPLVQVEELLRDFAVPRYGLPVSVRGRDYRMEWSPIALTEGSGDAGAITSEVASLAGAVLTMQLRDPAQSMPQPPPAALWDYDRRRDSCLQLQELAALNSPLLIEGEGGSGKSTFAVAAHYLSPVAASGNCYRWLPRDGQWQWPQRLGSSGTLIVEDLHRLSPESQRSLVRHLRHLPRHLRLVATCTDAHRLEPALAQCFSSLAIRLPPLRTMRPALERFAVAMLRQRFPHGQAPALHGDLPARLRVHDWPDNFSGFGDYLSAAVSRCQRRGGAEIELADLPELAVRAQLPWRDWSRGLGYREMMEQLERALFCELAAEQASTRELARRLGLSHTAVANKLRKYGLARVSHKDTQ